MSDRPAVSYDADGPGAELVRTWLLQLGAEPVDRAAPGASDLPSAPQHADVERAEVASFVRGLRGSERTRWERFDDHGSAENWPRGSF